VGRELLGLSFGICFLFHWGERSRQSPHGSGEPSSPDPGDLATIGLRTTGFKDSNGWQ
jgi:hypothetical protein